MAITPEHRIRRNRDALKPPPGYRLVVEGKTRAGDLLWSDDRGEWMDAGAAGQDVAEQVSVARRK